MEITFVASRSLVTVIASLKETDFISSLLLIPAECKAKLCTSAKNLTSSLPTGLSENSGLTSVHCTAIVCNGVINNIVLVCCRDMLNKCVCMIFYVYRNYLFHHAYLFGNTSVQFFRLYNDLPWWHYGVPSWPGKTISRRQQSNAIL